LVVTELASLLRVLVLRARIGGRRGLARVLALCHAALGPTALHRAAWRACVLLHRLAQGRLSPAELAELDDDVRAVGGSGGLRAAFEWFVPRGAGGRAAVVFDMPGGGGEPVPAPAGVAEVTALCALGRLADAAAALDHLDRHPVVPTGGSPDDDDL